MSLQDGHYDDRQQVMEERLINLKVFDANWLCRSLDWFRNGITLERYCKNSIEIYGCYLTPELFEELRKYRFGTEGIRDRKNEDVFPDPEFGYNATSLLEQIAVWADISEDRKTSPEIDYPQFQKEYNILKSYYPDIPD